MTKVCINPGVSAITNDNGVGQVVHAQFKYLPACGIELVGPDSAEVIACHITQAGMPRVDVLHCHGLYWSDLPHAHYQRWHHDANMQIVAAARQAYAVTVPSAWVAEPFKRDMRLSPLVIGHGVDLAEWEPVNDARPFYALWNKNRASDVCDPLPALELARRGVDVVSTFGPELMPMHEGLRVVGPQPHAKMKELVRHAGAYLATTRETFGIGTLEALAAGVPVVGYNYGGTADIVEHGVSGWLVPEGDIDGLLAGIQWVQAHPEAQQAARDRAACFSWQAVAERYAEIYHWVAEEKRRERHGVSVVITNYNYGQYVKGAIESCLAQTQTPEVVVVDDGSTDDSARILAQWHDHPSVQVLQQQNQGVAAARNAGIAAATGAYVVCLDADDQLHPDYCRVLADALRADRGLGVAYSGLGILQDNGTVNPNPWPPDFDWKAQTTPANPPSNCIPCAAMFRRSMWERAGGYKQVHAPAEDTEFFTRGLSVGFTAKRVTQEPLFWYRMHAGSASRTKQYKPIDTWHPWMRDQQYPIGAPNPAPVPVRSYAEPLISVIIPCGPGHAKHLPTAIESLLGQTFRGWEVIVGADCPQSEIDQALGDTYPFVRCCSTAKPGSGPGAARNAGLRLARAPLVLFLDADDYLVPDALTQFLEAYVATQGRYVYSDWFAYRNGEMVHDKAIEYSQTEWLYKGYHAVSALIPAEWVRSVGGFDETIRGWEDWDFFLKLAIAGYCGHRHAAPLLVYRQDTGTIRDVSLERSDELLAVLRDRYAAYGPGGDQQMASCCGGNADTLLAAKAAIAAANAPTGAEAAFLPQTHVAAEGPPTARLKFTGPQRGAITYVGRPSGRQYRFGNNPLEQYGDVDPRDVEYLVNFGVFELVSQPRQPIIPPQAEVTPPPAPQAAAGERPMLDLAGDLPADLEAEVNRQAQKVRKQVREKAA